MILLLIHIKLKMIINKTIKNIIIYSLLITGYVFIYVIDIESYIYKNNKKEVESKSKVNFIYQQF
jgi:hypothetical protein